MCFYLCFAMRMWDTLNPNTGQARKQGIEARVVGLSKHVAESVFSAKAIWPFFYFLAGDPEECAGQLHLCYCWRVGRLPLRLWDTRLEEHSVNHWRVFVLQLSSFQICTNFWPRSDESIGMASTLPRLWVGARVGFSKMFHLRHICK